MLTAILLALSTLAAEPNTTVDGYRGIWFELGQKGEHWAAIDGTYGVTRSFHPKEQIRFSWHAEEDAPRTVVDLQLSGDAASTRLDLAHEHLPEDADVDALAARWQAALEAIAAA